jgi:hypothetical protein
MELRSSLDGVGEEMELFCVGLAKPRVG